MKTLTSTHGITYQLIEDGNNLPIAYHLGTPPKVIDYLERARKNHIRIRIYLGDAETGKSWNEENDVAGYVGLSKGREARFPILLCNSRSFGGGSLLDHCIVKIKTTLGGTTLYKHPNYKDPIIDITSGDLSGYPYNVNIDGQLHRRCKTLKQAETLKTRML